MRINARLILSQSSQGAIKTGLKAPEGFVKTGGARGKERNSE
jgi:hypothetical protein